MQRVFEPTSVATIDVLRKLEAGSNPSECDLLLARSIRRGRRMLYETANDLLSAMPRRLRSSACRNRHSDSGNEMSDLLEGMRLEPGQQHGVAVTLTGWEGWFAVLPPLAVSYDAAFRATASQPEFGVIHLRFYREREQWTVRHSHATRPAAELHCGRLDSDANTVRLESPSLPKSFLKGAATAGDVVVKLLDRLRARVRLFKLIRTGEEEGRLTTVDGFEVKPWDLDQYQVAKYAELMPEEAPKQEALRQALMDGDPAAVREALRAGADVNGPLPDSFPALSLALLKIDKPDWFECLCILLDAGARFDGDAETEPALFSLFAHGRRFETRQVEAIQELARRGADLNIRSMTGIEVGYTPLQVASRKQSMPVIRELIRLGADPAITSVHGKKASDYVGQQNVFDPQPTAQQVRALLTAAEAGAPLPPAEAGESLGMEEISDRVEAAFDEYVTLAELERELASNPAAATPEMVAWFAVLSQPPVVTLKPVARPKFRAPKQVAALESQFVSAGFTRIGTFETGMKSLLLVAFFNEAAKLYGVLYELGTTRQIDVVRFNADGAGAVTATTTPDPGLPIPQRRGAVKLRVPGGTVADLVAAVAATKPPKGGVADVSAADFPATFAREYAADMGPQRQWAYRAYMKHAKAQEKA